MKKLVFATHNKHKLRELKECFQGEIELLSLTDINCLEDIPETADSLEGNALLKVRYVKQKYGYDCFSDDTGLEVEALGGAPGVYSARYAGEEADANSNMEKLLMNMSDVVDRSAKFRTVIALILEGEEYLFEGFVAGEILTERCGENGFGYDPVFRPDGFLQSFAQMNECEKNKLSHRGRAVKELGLFLAQRVV